jgi:inosine-uridine nucleoside N-ribohydrolase
VAAGADVEQGYYRYAELGYPQEERYWPEPVAPSPGALDGALRLLKQSIEQGATIVAIGPLTNLCLLEAQHPGILFDANLFLMGGYLYPIRPGFPQWGNDSDWNIQVDVRSARYVLEHSNPTLIPVTITVETALRRAYLNELRQAGKLGELIARQAEAFALDEKIEARFGQSCSGWPRDIINFQHDSLACAIALGWAEGVEVEKVPLLLEEKDGFLIERVHPSGKPLQVVTKIDGPRFNQFWLDSILDGAR